jgi:hypothetical protein
MTFLNPLLLLGLAAAAIPLIIHLFNFRRPRRIEFSSLAFLHELKKSTMQRVRIKQWLLLALRTLAIAALALSFARPTLEGAMAGLFGNQGRTTTALVFDHSTSMTMRDGSGAYLDQAKLIATELLADFESGDEFILVPQPTFSSSSSSSSSSSVVSYQNASAARDAIQAMEPEQGSSSLVQSIQLAANELTKQANLNRILYVVSDFQTSTFSDSTQLNIPDDVRLIFLPIGTDGRGNLAVSDVSVLSQIISEGQPVRIEAGFTNFGAEDANGVVASVFIEDVRVGQATLDIPAGTSASAFFVVTPRQTGWLSGRIEIEDNQYLYDNVRRFTLLVPEERRLLVVGGNRAPKGYLHLGLSENLTTNSVRFRTDEIAETALSGAALGTYDSVVLNGVSSLSTGEQSALVAYVTGGGGLLIFPSNDFPVEDFNGLFSDLNAGKVIASAIDSDDGLTVGVFESVDTDHVLFEGMFELDVSGKAPQLEQPVIYKSITYRPGANSGAEQTIIGLSGGAPFLQEIRAGLGSVLLFSVEAGVTWSDFPVRGLFLPLLYRSLYYLSASSSVSGETMQVEGSLQLRLAGVSGSETIIIRDESGLEMIPEQRSVQGAKVAELSSAFFIPGVYSVVANNEVLRRVVVHPSTLESDLALLDPEEAVSHIAETSQTVATVMNISLVGGSQLDEQLKAARTGVELWNVFLGLALIFLVLEMLVSKHWRPESAL